MDNLNTAFGLLVVGMVTVFIILWLVVLIGNLVVQLTNRFIPEKGSEGGGSPGGVSVNGGTVKKTDPRKLAAIVASVDAVTQGRGKVDSIEKQ